MKSVGPLVRHEGRAPAVAMMVAAGLSMLPWMVIAGLEPLAAPAWVVMAGIAATTFGSLKVLTLAGHWRAALGWRGAAYLFAWPGLNAPAFFGSMARVGELVARPGELVFALTKMLFGLGLVFWATTHAWTEPGLIVGWVGMIGIIFTLHFGVMHVASWIWRRAGLNAPPIMNAPMRAVSLAEFWSERWNVAFADVARRFVFRPLARRWGALKAGGAVFLISGLVHELVISLPARGGWGGPTLYFALHAAGIAIERSRAGKAAGLGRGASGWLWTLGFTVLPLPLLFHAPFVERVIVPMLKDFFPCLP